MPWRRRRGSSAVSIRRRPRRPWRRNTKPSTALWCAAFGYRRGDGQAPGYPGGMEATRGVVAAAVEDLEEGEAAVALAWARGVRVWGHHSAIRMTSTIQAIMTNLQFNAAMSLGLAVVVSALALVLTW